MEDILKQANETIANKVNKDRKKEAYDEFVSCFAVSCLRVAITGEGQKPSDAIDDMANVFKEQLIKKSFEIKAREKEVEAKLMLAHVGLMLDKSIETQESFENFMQKQFDELFWNKCIFDTQGV